MVQTVRMDPLQPWWRIGMVWVAFGGPALVVVASFVTLFFAIHGRDLPLDEQATTEAAAADAKLAPAVQARNHAATPRP
ncbi:MAG: nitrogen fixation protein FixH [Burkholderiaceae bacterium]